MPTSPFRNRTWIRVPRSLLSATFFALFGLGGLLIGGGVFPILLLFGERAWVRRAMRALVRASWWLFVAGGRVTGLFRVSISAEDRARLAQTRGCVIVANHITLIDVVVLSYVLPDMTAIAKAAAGRNFFYSRIVQGVFLSNNDPLRVLDGARDLFADGVNLVVFPEGTRQPSETTTRHLKRGAAQIALHAGVPVVPVFITCDPPVLGKGAPWYDVADRVITYRLEAREPIPVATQGTGGAFSHAAAVALTEQIRERLWGERGRACCPQQADASDAAR